ncbi:AAA family ATPase [Chryseobacterium vaccae]|uniref:AAA family ATPase n=1 Tax=Chryseobacterium vaccae TaxID=2604424 RepID=UPI001626B75F|nr:ATP-binding protein [Chryseobacterium vaccae]
MIKLTKFEINNYRSCLKSNIDLNQSLMCLIGINGAGKTNILNGLLLLKKLKESYRIPGTKQKNLSGSLTEISLDFKLDEYTIKVKGTLRYETDDRNNDEVLDSILKFNFFDITGSKKWIEIPLELFKYIHEIKFKENDFILREYFKLPDLVESQINALYSIRDFFNNISYYSASQFSDPSKCPISFELDENKSYRSNRFNFHHEKFLNDLYIKYKNNKNEFNKFISTVNQEGIGIINNISFSEYDMPSSSYEVKSGGKIRKIERNRQLIIPYVTIDGVELSPNQLSEGTFKTLALIFYIITDENELLLIEEPEVCVHHGLLNSIISLISVQSKKKQIIISTHSDFVLDRLSPENLLIVTKNSQKGTVAKPLDKALSKNDYKALKSYLQETGNLGEYWKEGGLDHE